MGDDEEDEGRILLYQVICLQDMPPQTYDEQDQCLMARTVCWRLKAARRRSA